MEDIVRKFVADYKNSIARGGLDSSIVEDEDLLHQGEPIFTEQDLQGSRNELDLLIRKLFIKKKITTGFFTLRHAHYARTKLGLLESQVGNNKGNLLRPLRAGNITYKVFRNTLLALGFDITEIKMKLRAPDGTIVDISI